MKIQGISGFAFKGNREIFDVHGHVGKMYDGMHGNKLMDYSVNNIISTVEPHNVKGVMVSSLSGLSALDSDIFQSEVDNAKEMAKLSGNEKVKLYPLISCQPGISKDTSAITQALESGEFYGMKFHPSNTNMPIKDNFEIYSQYMNLAQEKRLPSVFHSVTDGKSDPEQIIKLAKKHPNHPVVLYHIDLMANPEQMTKTIDDISKAIKTGEANLFVDISWLTGMGNNAETNKRILKQALEKIGENRIMFGSDTPISEMGTKEEYGKFVGFIENTIKEFYKDKPEEAEKALNKIFSGNAENLFVNKTWAQPNSEEIFDLGQEARKTIKNVKKEIKKSIHKGWFVVGGVVALGVGVLLDKFLIKKENSNPPKQ